MLVEGIGEGAEAGIAAGGGAIADVHAVFGYVFYAALDFECLDKFSDAVSSVALEFAREVPFAVAVVLRERR